MQCKATLKGHPCQKKALSHSEYCKEHQYQKQVSTSLYLKYIPKAQQQPFLEASKDLENLNPELQLIKLLITEALKGYYESNINEMILIEKVEGSGDKGLMSQEKYTNKKQFYWRRLTELLKYNQGYLKILYEKQAFSVSLGESELEQKTRFFELLQQKDRLGEPALPNLEMPL